MQNNKKKNVSNYILKIVENSIKLKIYTIFDIILDK